MRIHAELWSCQSTGEVRQQLPFADVWLSFAFAPGDSGIAGLALQRTASKTAYPLSRSVFLGGLFQRCLPLPFFSSLPHLASLESFSPVVFLWLFDGAVFLPM